MTDAALHRLRSLLRHHGVCLSRGAVKSVGTFLRHLLAALRQLEASTNHAASAGRAARAEREFCDLAIPRGQEAAAAFVARRIPGLNMLLSTLRPDGYMRSGAAAYYHPRSDAALVRTRGGRVSVLALAEWTRLQGEGRLQWTAGPEASTTHAPRGGLTIGGRHYAEGATLPAAVLAEFPWLQRALG